MTAAYAEAQRRRRGLSSERNSQGGLTERDKSKTYFDEAHGVLGCRHYRRGAKLQCSTCNHWATCRYCHDEQEDHKLIRYPLRLSVCIYIQEGDSQHALYALLNRSKSRAILPELSYSVSQILL
jgi:uncharacterized CHY-type Zn-finger protein